MKCIAVRHVAFEDLGAFAEVLTAFGYEVEYRQAGVDDIASTPWREAELAVVLGGPIGVYEFERYPWLNEEIAAVRARLLSGRPVLGVCLGAQVMAAALGARVYASGIKEIGWSELRIDAADAESCLAPLRGVPVLHWHGDTFDLPAGTRRLASTELTPHQAFALGHHGLALQFHTEVDITRIETWLIGHTAELSQAGIDVAALRAASRRCGPHAAVAGRQVLAGWLRQLHGSLACCIRPPGN